MSEVVVTRNPWKATVTSVSKDGRSVKVSVARVVQHKKYQKRLSRETILMVDSGGASVEVGSVVEIIPCMKMSKTKSWRIISSKG